MLCMTPRRTDLASLRPHPLRQAHGGEPDHATVSSGRSRYLRGDERFRRQRPLVVPFQYVAPIDVSHPRHWASVHAPGWRALERHSLVGNTKRGTMKKRYIWILAVLALPCSSAGNAQQIYPSRPVRLVITVPPGGAADLIDRKSVV